MINVLHEAEMKTVELLVDHILDEKDLAERQKTLLRLTDVMEKYFGSLFEKQSFDDARRLITSNGKWLHFLNRALNELDRNVVKRAVMDLGFEAGFLA